ncbi:MULTISPECIES: helix-turn-helix domain-containing protein [unclassified Bacillus (in: firmicutes)]|uniref:helix-turn-helix domain-containing protein n=1 Tax=unclassified Bacillus (in: firmicutes) TaxID=185979 RepID=UPI0020D26280|nr:MULTISPECIES: helix-turn-helix domain-containing protein [unclassified Bacillus (in: firmicutes)]
MPYMNKDRLMKKLENHLRSTARQLIKFDTEEEVLQYLTAAFRSELYCDFVGVIQNEGSHYVIKAWSGNQSAVTEAFPLEIHTCSPKLLQQSLTYERADSPEACQMSNILKEAKVKTWFTVPLNDNDFNLGFCIVGFLNYVPLLDMETHFEEFGKDIAVAMAMAREKKSQLNKMEGIEWLSKNLSLNAPIEQQIAELTLRAGKGTNADFACIYLFDEKKNCFVYQPPSYGEFMGSNKIMIEENYLLNKYFPFLEKPGGSQLTVPLTIDLKTIGVLHIENQREVVFTENDQRMLELLSNHVAAIIENARLFNNEKEQKNRLQYLLDYQQALVKETVDVENFDGITYKLSSLFQSPVILFDRFMQPISVDMYDSEDRTQLPEAFLEIAIREKSDSKGADYFSMLVPNETSDLYSFWMINGGGSLLGFLALRRPSGYIDEIDHLTIELARNICSIQFIKQKLVLDAKEQAKDSFIAKLLVERIDDKEAILQYANLFQWDPFQSHQIAVMSISLEDRELKGSNLLEQNAKKNLIWDNIKSNLLKIDQKILCAYHDEKNILIVPIKDETTISKKFWSGLYDKLKKWANETSISCKIGMGIGGKTSNLSDYYLSYQQGIQALNIVNSRLQHLGFSLFDELGSYAILHHLNDSKAVDLFVMKQLGPLLSYSEGKNTDLCNTLHTYLQNNGNVKNTAEDLFIHRSSLLYRLERIESLLDVQLSDAEVRFNLMMALKLYDMYGGKIEKAALLSVK